MVVAAGLLVPPAAGATVVRYDSDGALVVTDTPPSYSVGQEADATGRSADGVLVFGVDDVTSYPERGSGTQGCHRGHEEEIPGTSSSSLYCSLSAAGVRFLGSDGGDEMSLYDLTVPVTMYGGKGDDNLAASVASTALAIYGEDGADTLSVLGQSVDAELDGGAGADAVRNSADSGKAKLLGGEGNDKLGGSATVDEVRGGEGDDQLKGENWGSLSPDVLDGGPGTDQLVLEDASRDAQTLLTVTQDGVADDGRAGERDNVISAEVIRSSYSGTFHGTPGNDDIQLAIGFRNAPSTVYGHDGNDLLQGERDKETLDGGPGDDTLYGGHEDDVVIGGPGRDTLRPDIGSASYCSSWECYPPFGNDRVEARDGEIDSIDCGAGKDVVIADPIDTVAENCETVDRGSGATNPDPQPQPQPKPVDPQPSPRGEVFDAGAFAALGRPRLRQLARRGVSFQVACRAACRVSATLTLAARSARRAGLRKTALGRTSASLASAGTARPAIKVAGNAATRLARLRQAELTLTVVVTDAAGKSTVASKKLVLRP